MSKDEPLRDENVPSTSEALPSPCTLFSPLTQNGAPVTSPSPKKTLSHHSISEREARKIAREITEIIVRRATAPRRVKKTGKPKMKSGCMEWGQVIPNFDIDDDVFTQITFNENLLISTFDGKNASPTPVGGLCLNILPGRGGPLGHQTKDKGDFLLPKFLVHLSSQLDFMEYNGGSRITAWVDRDLQTLEEKRREYLQLEDALDQQMLYVSSQSTFYYLRHDKKTDLFYSYNKAKNLICEGSNFVLMRYLAITRFVGSFEVPTLYIDGSLCRNIYDCRGPSGGIVNNQKFDVCKIYRTVIEKCGTKHTSITLLTLDGQILKQEWRECGYLLQVNPLCVLKPGKPVDIEHIPLENRQDDLQMLSQYLDAKTRYENLSKNYMQDHPEIKHMLADYLQSILHLKPEDIFEFTAKYFLAFTPSLLPLSEYYEPTYNEDEDDEDFEFWKYI